MPTHLLTVMTDCTPPFVSRLLVCVVCFWLPRSAQWMWCCVGQVSAGGSALLLVLEWFPSFCCNKVKQCIRHEWLVKNGVCVFSHLHYLTTSVRCCRQIYKWGMQKVAPALPYVSIGTNTYMLCCYCIVLGWGILCQHSFDQPTCVSVCHCGDDPSSVWQVSPYSVYVSSTNDIRMTLFVGLIDWPLCLLPFLNNPWTTSILPRWCACICWLPVCTYLLRVLSRGGAVGQAHTHRPHHKWWHHTSGIYR